MLAQHVAPHTRASSSEKEAGSRHGDRSHTLLSHFIPVDPDVDGNHEHKDATENTEQCDAQRRDHDGDHEDDGLDLQRQFSVVDER